MPVGRLPHVYHNGMPNQMQMMPNAVNMYPAPSSSSSVVAQVDGVSPANTETWSDASSKIPSSSAPPVADQRPVRNIDRVCGRHE